MPRGIIIFGSSGSGKTTLGRLVAEKLGFPYFDLDDYIWRRDTAIPFSVMYSREEKASRLMRDISAGERFVMAGSMSSFKEPFEPLFDLGVHLTAPAELRVERVHRRELEQFGARVLECGDMYEEHKSFLSKVARYDTDGSPRLSEHLMWIERLRCEVISLSGIDVPEHNVDIIVRAYRAATARV